MVTQKKPYQRSTISVHAEWISLLEVSGPFLGANVLAAADRFRQGLPSTDDDNRIRAAMRGYYGQWRDDIAKRKPSASLHRLWLKVVMEDVLDWDEVLAERTELSPSLLYAHPETGETIRPDFALLDPDTDKPAFLISTYPATQRLKSPVAASRWAETPAKRMEELLHATNIRLGVVTNGEEWMLVNAPAEETTGFTTWYANLWFEEPITLTAFRALLGIEQLFGVGDGHNLIALLNASADDQADVTYTLGDQVRQAIELLVAAIDKEDDSRNGALLEDVEDETVYEAAVTVMMRLVFLLFAEDQQPPLFGGNDIYDRNYSVSAMIAELENTEQQSGIEYLDQKYDAWQRLLATFRLVYAGSPHDLMRQPAYGGSLFEPDRFPFLEGRQPGSSWLTDEASPLPVSNRTVLHILQALQFIQLKGAQGRQRISFRALDVEQIGHVYEQLLEHTAKRSRSDVLGLVGTTKKGIKQEPELEISQLEEWELRGEKELVAQLKKATGRSETAIQKLIAAEPDDLLLTNLRHVCGDEDTFERILQFANLIREDRAEKPMVIRPGGLYVTSGSDRATTGSHYTPRSLTEPIVQYALEPLIYDGPAEGKPREEWILHSPKHLLELNICDPAMGSGGFLVQTCRYLADRLLEAWGIQEETALAQNKNVVLSVASDGSLHQGDETEHLLPQDKAERLAIARQMVVDHCLYGVDINHLAVDMAKLSLWLITLQRDRPFTFLDHRLRCGDSLLGIHNRDQLLNFSLDGKRKDMGDAMFAQLFRNVMQNIRAARDKIAAIEVRDVTDSQRQAALLEQAEKETQLLKLGANLLVAAQLHPEKKKRGPQRSEFRDRYSLLVDGYDRISRGAFTEAGKQSILEAHHRLEVEANRLLEGKRPFHWLLEFPELFEELTAFSSIIGNPPFLGGKRLTGALGTPFRDYLVEHVASGDKGSADFCAYFLRRGADLASSKGTISMLLTNTISQGDTKEVGLDGLPEADFSIYFAVSSMKWPGAAQLEIAQVCIAKGEWKGTFLLNGLAVSGISNLLKVPGRVTGDPERLIANRQISFIGSVLSGSGFVLSHEEAEDLVNQRPENKAVIQRYLNGSDLNTDSVQSATRSVINFGDRSLAMAEAFPEVLEVVRSRVKPHRDKVNREIYRKYWWRFAETVPGMYRAISPFESVIVKAQVSSTWEFAFVSTDQVLDAKLIVFATDLVDFAGLLQSQVHYWWAMQFATTMKTDMSYTPQRIFETFPTCDVSGNGIGEVASRYFTLRQRLCQSQSIGLTKVHHLINSPTDQSDAMLQIRSVRRQLDEQVAAAYGWEDIQLDHGFHDTSVGTRYTIGEDAKQEVIDRLLELNQQRYAEEQKLAEREKNITVTNVKQKTMF